MTVTTHVDEVELPRRLLNITELADFLGVNTRHVRRLVAERRVPFDAPMDRQVVIGVSRCR